MRTVSPNGHARGDADHQIALDSKSCSSTGSLSSERRTEKTVQRYSLSRGDSLLASARAKALLLLVRPAGWGARASKTRRAALVAIVRLIVAASWDRREMIVVLRGSGVTSFVAAPRSTWTSVYSRAIKTRESVRRVLERSYPIQRFLFPLRRLRADSSLP
jgi:hypothetical protein